MNFRPRYSLRTLLLACVVVALLLAAGRWLYDWWRWAHYRAPLEQWSAALERRPQHPEVVAFWLDGRMFYVSTAELKVRADGDLEHNGAPIDPRRFWLYPPGKWVSSIEEVLRVARHAEAAEDGG